MGYASSTLVKIDEAIRLPGWLQAFNLSDEQIRHVVEIDRELEQRLKVVLTRYQYSQWRGSHINIADETQYKTWTFEDLNIELSPYQKMAIKSFFEAAMEKLLHVLSPEQKRHLIRRLSENEMNTGPRLVS